MSNDIINHDALNSREKELRAELDWIENTRRLFKMQTMQLCLELPSIPKRTVNPVKRKLTGANMTMTVPEAFEYFGGVDKFKRCERNAKQSQFLTSRSFGEKGYRVTLHDFNAKSKTGKTEKRVSVGYFTSKTESDTFRDQLLNHYRANKHNN